jgi:serine-type D-Ala-D-Ala carboxypeptidase (penicillin-binding protein 5/6)
MRLTRTRPRGRRAPRWAIALPLVLAALVAPFPSAAGAAAPPMPGAAAWILVDPSDDATLASGAPDARRAIASTTKLMTAYLALRELPLDRELTAAEYNPVVGESLIGLSAGDRITVRDLLYGLLLASGNDAAVTLAVGVSGSVEAFVGEMNAAARELGLDDTHYANPIGLDAPGNYSTAEDLVALTIRLRRDPVFREIVDTPVATVTISGQPVTVENRNVLVGMEPWVNGVKTGFTGEAGNVLVGSGTRDGVTLVSAVLGAPSEAERDAATLELLRYGLSLYGERTAVKARQRLGSVGLSYRDERVPLVASREVRLTVRRDQDIETDVVRARAEVDEAERGERLGLAVVTVDGEPEARVPLIARVTVGPPGLIDRVDAALPGSRTAAWALIGLGVVALVLIVIGFVVAGDRGGRVVGRRQ